MSNLNTVCIKGQKEQRSMWLVTNDEAKQSNGVKELEICNNILPVFNGRAYSECISFK